MGRLTPQVFNESCCDGGECSPTHESAQPCGCDPGAKWVCEYHRRAEPVKVGIGRFASGLQLDDEEE
jgi:hypothetical protein